VIIVRPRFCSIALTDVDRIPDVIYPAYLATLDQLSGPHFLDRTEQEILQVHEFLGIQDIYCGRKRRGRRFRRTTTQSRLGETDSD
jgi:hypothetical protein